MRRERYVKNRKKRAEGSRAHRGTASYSEGKQATETVCTIVVQQLEHGYNYRALAKDLSEAFIKSQGTATRLQSTLFTRHFKSLVMAKWPQIRRSMTMKGWSYIGIRVKP